MELLELDNRLVGDSRGADAIDFRILATSDLHAHIMPYDYFTDQKVNRFGLARTASLIEQSRSETANSLLFDNGDFLTGTPVSDPHLADDPAADNAESYAVVDAMNLLKYSAAAIGNHEFNFGLEMLRKHADRAEFPFLCANLILPAPPSDTDPIWVSHVLLSKSVRTRNGGTADLKIAVFGLAPPQCLNWDQAVLPPGIEARDMVETARDLVPRLRADGADIVVALCHTGFGRAEATPNMENALVPLSKVPGIDALIGGHTHVVFPEGCDDPGLLNGVPTVIPGFFGSHLGQIDLVLRQSDDGRWTRVDGRARAEPVFRPGRQAGSAGRVVRQDKALIRQVRAAHKQTLAKIRQPLGFSAVPLQSYFALVAPDTTLGLVARAKTGIATAAKAAGLLPDLPVLSAVAPFRAGGRNGPESYIDLAAGPLTMRNAAELYQYPNYATVVEMTRSDIYTWLEWSAGLFKKITAGVARQPLLRPDFPSYNFDVLHGLTYTIDPTQPSRYCPAGNLADAKATRIKDLRYQGRPVQESDRFLVVTNSYRTGGGGGSPQLFQSSVLFESRRALRDIVVDYLRSGQNDHASVAPVWSFPTLARTAAQFESGGGGVVHLPLPQGPTITSEGPTDHGFHRYTLCFDLP